ncbi:hypothetical protein HAALTHF_00550n [Vreelandella aquamarina]|nr:hypothetical protein HAALTHF_00550n [Halomonas axialensis]
MKHSPAYRLAATVLHGFDEYRARFKQITSDASRRFRDAAWREAQQASAARINLYGEKSRRRSTGCSAPLPRTCWLTVRRGGKHEGTTRS